MVRQYILLIKDYYDVWMSNKDKVIPIDFGCRGYLTYSKQTYVFEEFLPWKESYEYKSI